MRERVAIARELDGDFDTGDERVDAEEVADIVREASSRRNGWKVILARCAMGRTTCAPGARKPSLLDAGSIYHERVITPLLIIFWLAPHLPDAGVHRKPDAGTYVKPEAVGFYSLGCLVGAVKIGPDGPGYQAIRLRRDRNWGHPALAAFLDDYGAELQTAALGPILIGDASQRRGGRMRYGHRSHQTGLDVDVWFTTPEAARKKPLPLDAREELSFPSLIDGKAEKINRKRFQPRHVELLRRAAAHDEVERIFVNFAIKAELCRAEGHGPTAWHRKVRPWFGHDEHFHVRLKCPPGSEECIPQGRVDDDGCEHLDWFTRAYAPKRRAEPRTTGGPRRILPARCKDER